MATPDEHVDLNLDTIENEQAKNVGKPFAFVLNGRRIVMGDPTNIKWQDLVDIGDNPVKFFKYAVTEEDRIFFRDTPLEGWKLRKLVDGYMKHYGIDLSQGNAAASLI